VESLTVETDFRSVITINKKNSLHHYNPVDNPELRVDSSAQMIDGQNMCVEGGSRTAELGLKESVFKYNEKGKTGCGRVV
jgi:hypothetical protein